MMLWPPSAWFAARKTVPDQEPRSERVASYAGRMAGVYMSEDEALRLSAVWACVTVIAKSLAASDWHVFDEDDAGNRIYRRNSRLWALLNIRPNPEMTPYAWREAALIQALIWGNHYSEIEWDGAGRAVALWPLDPDRCCLERDLAGSLVVRVSNPSRGMTYLPYEDVFHLHGPSVDGIAGMDTVNIALRSLSQVAAAEKFASAFFGNGTSFGGVLSTDKIMSDQTKDNLRKQINGDHGGPEKAFKFLLLDSNLKWERLTVTPNEAQFLESRMFLIEEVCRWFGVPPHKIAHLLRATNNNIEHQGLEFVRDALTPWKKRLKQEADWKLIVGGGRRLRTEIDTDWLAEGDAKSKAEADKALVQGGIMTINEARKKRGLNTVGPAGDTLMVQQQMIPIEQVGQVQDPAAAQEPDQPMEGEPQ